MRRAVILAAFAATAAAGPVAAISAASADTTYGAQINQGNVPTTAAAYQQDCNSDEFGGKDASQDGWLFVASPDNFTAFKAIYTDASSTEHDVVWPGSNETGVGVSFPKPHEHLAVVTPGGWTLTNAYANLDGDRNEFVLSHTCAAQSSPPQQQSTPPSAHITGSCASATIDMTAGTSDTTFAITRTNDTSGTDVLVAAGKSDSRTVTLDSAHPGVSVSANGKTLDSFTRQSSCESNNDNNNQSSDTGSSSSTTSSGTTSSSQSNGAAVSAETANRQPSVKTGTTKTAGKPTRVLGQKLTKPAAAAATGTASLPNTGAPTLGLVATATVALEFGLFLLVLGARRPARD